MFFLSFRHGLRRATFLIRGRLFSGGSKGTCPLPPFVDCHSRQRTVPLVPGHIGQKKAIIAVSRSIKRTVPCFSLSFGIKATEYNWRKLNFKRRVFTVTTSFHLFYRNFSLGFTQTVPLSPVFFFLLFYNHPKTIALSINV